MAKRKRTIDSTSLNPFRESVVKTISASINYNADGRSTLVRTMQTADGEQHTFTTSIPANIALEHIRQVWTEYREPNLEG
jgi:hypothetical protein